MTGRPLRFGLAGTGYWAQVTHAPALAATDGIQLTAIWGRNAAAAQALAAEYQATAFSDFGGFLAAVDAVSFSVPPDVQHGLAIRAATAGKHLLLEKPVGTTAGQAEQLSETVSRAGVASVVFFTARFQPDVRDWLAGVARQEGWAGASAAWLGSALAPSSPFNTPWRREKGGLWDLGPHVVSLLWASLGPVRWVSADAGQAGLSCLVLHHESGTTSTAVLTAAAPASSDRGCELYLWGEPGRSTAPTQGVDPVAALQLAAAELTAAARAEHRAHPCDVHFGRDVTSVLAEAQRQLDTPHRPPGSAGQPGQRGLS